MQTDNKCVKTQFSTRMRWLAGFGCLLALAACAQGPAPAQLAARATVIGEYYDPAKQKLRVVKAMPVSGPLLDLAATGAPLSDDDRKFQTEAAAAALTLTPSGIETRWFNPATGRGGIMMPVRTYRASSREYCRTLRETLQADDRVAEATHVACRRPDRDWRIVENAPPKGS